MGGAGILGVDYDPLVMHAAGRPPENTSLATDQQRFQRRLGLSDRLQTDYANHGGKQEVSDHQKIYAQAATLVLSPKMEGFDLDKEPQNVKDAYGSSPFAQGCLLARRLIETGVTFVEVTLGNWDTHQDNFNRSRTLCGQLDQPFAALLADLKSRGLLDSTLVIWTGEFGRTPRINPNSGRDHFPRAFTVVLAGGGVKGGQVIGRTDAGGEASRTAPFRVNDLLRTVCHSLGIDADKQNMSSIGRPISIVDGGEVVKEVVRRRVWALGHQHARVYCSTLSTQVLKSPMPPTHREFLPPAHRQSASASATRPIMPGTCGALLGPADLHPARAGRPERAAANAAHRRRPAVLVLDHRRPRRLGRNLLSAERQPGLCHRRSRRLSASPSSCFTIPAQPVLTTLWAFPVTRIIDILKVPPPAAWKSCPAAGVSWPTTLLGSIYAAAVLQAVSHFTAWL